MKKFIVLLVNKYQRFEKSSAFFFQDQAVQEYSHSSWLLKLEEEKHCFEKLRFAVTLRYNDQTGNYVWGNGIYCENSNKIHRHTLRAKCRFS
jgi:hypothetical protein